LIADEKVSSTVYITIDRVVVVVDSMVSAPFQLQRQTYRRDIKRQRQSFEEEKID
jgi:hypothetical protein